MAEGGVSTTSKRSVHGRHSASDSWGGRWRREERKEQVEASTHPGQMRLRRGELGGLGMKALDVPNCGVRNALL